MKPRFLEVIRLAVLLVAIAVVVGTVFNSYDDCRATVEGVGHSLQSADGVAGPLSWVWGWFTWFTYLFFIGCVTVVAVLILHLFGVFGMLMGKTAEGVVWLRHAWAPPPLPIDTVVDTSSNGAPITLGQVLKALNASVRELKARTAGLEPPPPPKTAEEVAAEKDAQLAEMAKELAAIREAMNRKTVAVSQPAATPAPATGGAA